MPTQAQINANRRNAQKSTGPTSPEGKARSSLNALQSGIDAWSHIIPAAHPAALEPLAPPFLQHYHPPHPRPPRCSHPPRHARRGPRPAAVPPPPEPPSQRLEPPPDTPLSAPAPPITQPLTRPIGFVPPNSPELSCPPGFLTPNTWHLTPDT